MMGEAGLLTCTRVWNRASIVAMLVSMIACGNGDHGAQVITFSNSGLEISYRTEPSPPRSGKNVAYATVKSTDGSPVTDAHVSAVYYMPAMQSMNMPEMRNTFKLEHTANGNYRGVGELVMAGTWYVTVEVMRGAQIVAVDKFTVIAK